MSIKIMSYIWEQELDVKGTELLTLLAIADHANDEGIAWPALKKIAHKIRKGKQTASNSIARLERAHKLIVKRVEGEVNLYGVPMGIDDYKRLLSDMGIEKAPEYVALIADRRGKNTRPAQNSKGGENSKGGGIEFSDGGGENSGIEPSLTINEPSVSPTPPSGESDSANSVNGKKPKTGRSKEDLDALYNMICKGSFNKDHSEIDKPQRGRVLAIRKALLKAIPDVTAEELKQAYILYAQKNPEALEDVTRRLKSETKVPDWLQMAIDEGMVPTRQVTADPRASQKWQANAEIYRAYADAFSDRWSDAEILAQDFSGIEAWWFHTGQYEQGDGE